MRSKTGPGVNRHACAWGRWPRWRWPTIWIAATVVVSLVFRYQLAQRRGGVAVGLDFGIYWTAGSLANQGHDPYIPIVTGLGFVYPPFALLLFRLLALLPLHVGFGVWTVMNASLMSGMLVAIARRGANLLVLVLATASSIWCGYTVHGTQLGQVGLLLLGMVACDLVALDGRRGQGLLTGLAIGIKFTPAVFLVWFLSRGQGRAALTACSGFVLSVVVGVISAPGVSWQYWTGLFVHHRLGVGVPSQYGNANNQSVTNAAVLVFGHGALGAGRAAALALTVIGLLAGFLAARRSAWLAIAVLGVASCLMTSSTWDHHYIWLLAAVLALVTGDLSRLPVTAVVTLVWLAWSLGGRWRPLGRVPRRLYTPVQLWESVATPALAALFMVVVAAEIGRGVRRGAVAGRAAATPTGVE